MKAVRAVIPDATTLDQVEYAGSHPDSAAYPLVLQAIVSPDPTLASRSFPIRGAVLSLGRSSGAGGIADDFLSRVHAGVSLGDRGEVLVEDLGSRNGTYVDGERISGRRIAGAGAIIRIGNTVFAVDREPPRERLPASLDADDTLASELVGRSLATRRLRSAVATVAPLLDAVLIRGESGTGKEVTARAIHRLSGRTGPFVPVNCAAIPVHLAESELFGYKRGAFTGAETDRGGLFLGASGGTLFLDEIGELPLPVQAKLLRTLEDGRVQPLGTTTTIDADVRIVAATNAELAASSFREDLLARLDDWTLHLSPLRERAADVLPLLDCFTGGEVSRSGVSALFAEALLLHDWPFNAREVRKLARRLLALSRPGRGWQLDDLPESMHARAAARADDRDGPDRDQLEAALAAAGGNVSRVASELGRDRKQVYRWMSRFGLQPRGFRAPAR